MKITNIISEKKHSLSLEVFPPKAGANYNKVEEAALSVAKLKPSFVSVTYGAGGGTSDYTLNLSKKIQDECQVSSMAHLTCISSSKDTVKKQLKALADSGIENIMALRGDIPDEMKDCDRNSLDYQYAIQLIREIKESGLDFCIGGACYPECHPESKSQKEDIIHLKEKVDAGLDFLTTQMVFDNNLFFNFMYKLREADINVPVFPGIMPITNGNQIERIVKLSGAFLPQRFVNMVDHFGGDPVSMEQAGIAYATDQIIDLFANGISNVHVYTMNKPHIAEKIMENLSSILG